MVSIYSPISKYKCDSVSVILMEKEISIIYLDPYIVSLFCDTLKYQQLLVSVGYVHYCNPIYKGHQFVMEWYHP